MREEGALKVARPAFWSSVSILTSIAGWLFIAPATAANHQGDLVIYKGGLPLSAIGQQLSAPLPASGNAVLFMLDMGKVEGEPSTVALARKLKMIKTVQYLIENTKDNRLSEDTLVGLGSYPSIAIADATDKQQAASIHVPVARLGRIGSAHRRKLLTHLHQLQPIDALGSMATAYAEAGAYMMGSRTHTRRSSTSPLLGSFDTAFTAAHYPSPNYRVCELNNALTATVNANPYLSYDAFMGINEARAQTAIVQHAAIFFITSGRPAAAPPLPILKMQQSLIDLDTGDANTSEPSTDPSLMPTMTTASGSDLEIQQACAAPQSQQTSGQQTQQHWQCLSAYASRLNTPNNPSRRAIKTGVLVIAPDKPVIENNHCRITTTGQAMPGLDGLSQNYRYQQACQIGSAEQGGGGFYITGMNRQRADIQRFADAIKQRSEGLGGLPLASLASGQISSASINVPASPLHVGELMADGYMPMVTPNPGAGKSQWRGGLRRYTNSTKGYINAQHNRPFRAAADLMQGVHAGYWPSSRSTQQTDIHSNKDIATVRAVYLSQTQAGPLTKIEPVMASLKGVRLFSKPDEPTAAADITLQRLLLNYMGYSLTDYHPASTTDTQIRRSLSSAVGLTAQPGAAVIHSTPTAFVATARQDKKSGRYVADADSQYLLFGAMDNALHVINSSSGEEVLSYFPREVLAHQGQYKGITAELTADKHAGDNSPSFGVDGPWHVYTAYQMLTANTIAAEAIYAYGGARLGAKAYYGLDLTAIHNGGPPKQLFSIVKSGVFKRLGYSWGKPVVTKIRWQGEPKLVVILSGGYDAKYDKTDGQRIQAGIDGNAKPIKTDGNAVYIVDALTGAPLIVVSHLGTDVDQPQAHNLDNEIISQDDAGVVAVLNSHLRYSIPGGVRVLDRDADELTDHVYFADLNGQVFRLDIDNNVSVNPQLRVQRIAYLNGAPEMPGPRFYETPTVTIQSDAQGYKFATVSVVSGDRSNPLARNHQMQAVYTVYDKDVTQTGLFRSDFTLAPTVTARLPKRGLGIQSLQGAPLDYDHQLPSDITATAISQKYKGWMAPFEYYGAETLDSGAAHYHYLKGLGQMAAIGNKLYAAAYHPKDGEHDIQNGCAAEVLGSTEIYQYCLPYGICQRPAHDDNHHLTVDTKRPTDKPPDKHQQYQRYRAGRGLLAPSFGTHFSDSPLSLKSRRLINQGTEQTAFIALNSNQIQVKTSFQFKRSLMPLMWFDFHSKK